MPFTVTLPDPSSRITNQYDCGCWEEHDTTHVFAYGLCSEHGSVPPISTTAR